MGSTTRCLLTLAVAGLLVLLAPVAASAQQYPPSGGEEQPEGQPGAAETEPAAEESPPEGRPGAAEPGSATEGAGGGVVGALARTGAGVAVLSAFGMLSLALGAVFVRRARAA